MITVEQYEAAERELAQREAWLGWRIHATIYALVNTGLILIDFLVVEDAIWFFYPLIGWGIGLAMHYLRGVRRLDRELRERQARIERRAAAV